MTGLGRRRSRGGPRRCRLALRHAWQRCNIRHLPPGSWEGAGRSAEPPSHRALALSSRSQGLAARGQGRECVRSRIGAGTAQAVSNVRGGALPAGVSTSCRLLPRASPALAEPAAVATACQLTAACIVLRGTVDPSQQAGERDRFPTRAAMSQQELAPDQCRRRFRPWRRFSFLSCSEGAAAGARDSAASASAQQASRAASRGRGRAAARVLAATTLDSRHTQRAFLLFLLPRWCPSFLLRLLL